MTICLLLVQNLDFSDWSRNKRYLELSLNWFTVWQCDFRLKKSSELMNSIVTSDEASEESEFWSALNASPASFVHKSLKDEQIECIHRIVCHGRDVLDVLYGPCSQCHSKHHCRTPCFLLAYKVEQYLNQVLLLKLTHYERNRRTCLTK